MKPDGLRILGWIIPTVCMAVAGWVIYGQNQAFNEASSKRNKANRDVEQAQKEKELYSHLVPSNRHADEPQAPDEDTAFVNYLRSRCATYNVRFEQYRTQSIEYGKDKAATPTDPRMASLLKGLTKVSCTLTFLGNYADIRKLLGDLESSDRLYTLTNIIWKLDKDAVRVTLTISRYVSPVEAPEKTSAATAKPGTAAVKGTPGTKPAGPAGTVTPMNAVAPGKPGTTPSSAPLSAPGPHGRPGLPLKTSLSKPLSTVSPGVTTKP